MLACFPKGFLNGTIIISTMVPPPIVYDFTDVGILRLMQLSKAPRLHRVMNPPLSIILQFSTILPLIFLQNFLNLNPMCSTLTCVDLAALFTSQISLSVPSKH